MSSQFTLFRPALVKVQIPELEQVPGFVSVAIRVHPAEAASVMVTVTLPAPAEPAFMVKAVAAPYVPVVGVTLPLLTLTV